MKNQKKEDRRILTAEILIILVVILAVLLSQLIGTADVTKTRGSGKV